MRRFLPAPLLLLPLLPLLPLPAHAASVLLTQVAPPAVHHTTRPIDVAGIVPGMTPDAVAAALRPAYGAVRRTEETLGLGDGGQDVATQSYTTRMSATAGRNDVTVWFGTPTTGNGVVEVTEQMIYPTPADAPALDAVRARLLAKYGPPALDGPANGTGEVRLLAWSYKGDKPVPCAANACRADLTDGLSVADMGSYARAVRRGHELVVVAMLLAGTDDPAKAASVVVTVSDTAAKLRTLDTAIDQMRAAMHPAPHPEPASRRAPAR